MAMQGFKFGYIRIGYKKCCSFTNPFDAMHTGAM